MKCVLILQLPTPDLRYGHILAASTDANLIRQFCTDVLDDQKRKVETTKDTSQHEFQRLRLEQLHARLTWATSDAR